MRIDNYLFRTNLRDITREDLVFAKNLPDGFSISNPDSDVGIPVVFKIADVVIWKDNKIWRSSNVVYSSKKLEDVAKNAIKIKRFKNRNQQKEIDHDYLVGDRWYIKEPSKSHLVESKILDITDNTILFIINYSDAVRYKIQDVEFVEKF